MLVRTENSKSAFAAPKGLSKEDINGLPLFHYTGEVVLVRSEAECESAIQYLLAQDVVGFDTETRPSFRKGKSYLPSLVQAAAHDVVFLFHFRWLPFGERLIHLLEHDKIIKAGVAIHDDLRGLQKIASFTPHAAVDLGLLGRAKAGTRSGLRGLAAEFLGVRISKGEQCSDWSKELSSRQIRYAATDAWVSREIFLAMRNQELFS